MIDKATGARDRALHATFPEDRQFWLEMEARWLTLAGNIEHVERTTNFLATRSKKTKPPDAA